MISEWARGCLPYPVSGHLHLRKINQNWLGGSAVSENKSTGWATGWLLIPTAVLEWTLPPADFCLYFVMSLLIHCFLGSLTFWTGKWEGERLINVQRIWKTDRIQWCLVSQLAHLLCWFWFQSRVKLKDGLGFFPPLFKMATLETFSHGGVLKKNESLW